MTGTTVASGVSGYGDRPGLLSTGFALAAEHGRHFFAGHVATAQRDIAIVERRGCGSADLPSRRVHRADAHGATYWIAGMGVQGAGEVASPPVAVRGALNTLAECGIEYAPVRWALRRGRNPAHWNATRPTANSTSGSAD